MARISLKEQYDNKDVITQIYALIDDNAIIHEDLDTQQLDVDKAITDSANAVKKAQQAIDTADAQATAVAKAQADATLALQQAEDAQTDADSALTTSEIRTTAAEGSLWMKQVNNVEKQTNIPIASSDKTGLMNAQTYKSLVNLGVRVEALESKKSTAYVVFTSPTPTQEEITEKFTAAVGRPPIAGDSATDIAKALTYEYDGSTWIQTIAPISNWTNETAGIIKGTPATGAAGTLFAESDGTGSVNGWDELNTKITNGFITASKAFSGYSFTETATQITAKFDAVDGVTSVTEIIPSATAEKAGCLTAADWTRFGNKQNAIASASVTLTAAGWSGNSQTVACAIVTTDNIIWVSSSPSSFESYGKAGIRATAQGDGTITFVCTKVPTVDITAEVVA